MAVADKRSPLYLGGIGRGVYIQHPTIALYPLELAGGIVGNGTVFLIPVFIGKLAQAMTYGLVYNELTERLAVYLVGNGKQANAMLEGSAADRVWSCSRGYN